jgi:hypothetical protein
MIHKSTKILLIETALAVITFLLMTSCGTRKVSKSNTETKETAKTEIVTLDSSKTTTKVDTNENYSQTDDEEEITFVPVDNSKPITINGKTYFNTILKSKKKKSSTNIVKAVKVAQIEQKAVKTSSKAENSKTAKQNIKVIDKKANYFWLFWLLLLIPAYFLWQKFKDKIWFI